MATRTSSFEITFTDLWTRAPGSDERSPLAVLAGPEDHIHGTVTVVVDGSPLPALGYFGPDDVCLNEWAPQLVAIGAMAAGPTARTHVYDDGEQGQPAHHFAKVGDQVLVSVREGVGGGLGDPWWDQVPCLAEDVAEAVTQFEAELRRTLVTAAGDRGDAWVTSVLDRRAA